MEGEKEGKESECKSELVFLNASAPEFTCLKKTLVQKLLGGTWTVL